MHDAERCTLLLYEGSEPAALSFALAARLGLEGSIFYLTEPDSDAVVPLTSALPGGMMLIVRVMAAQGAAAALWRTPLQSPTMSSLGEDHRDTHREHVVARRKRHTALFSRLRAGSHQFHEPESEQCCSGDHVLQVGRRRIDSGDHILPVGRRRIDRSFSDFGGGTVPANAAHAAPLHVTTHLTPLLSSSPRSPIRHVCFEDGGRGAKHRLGVDADLATPGQASAQRSPATVPGNAEPNAEAAGQEKASDSLAARGDTLQECQEDLKSDSEEDAGRRLLRRHSMLSQGSVADKMDEVEFCAEAIEEAAEVTAVAAQAMEQAVDRFQRLSADLANERTLLAWHRTSLATIRTIFAYLAVTAADPLGRASVLATTLAAVAVMVLTASGGWWRYSQIKKALLARDSVQNFHRMSNRWMNGLVLCMAIATAGGISSQNWVKG